MTIETYAEIGMKETHYEHSRAACLLTQHEL